MNVYLISQSKNIGYDTYDSAVVVAPTAEEAQATHPSGYGVKWWGKENYDGIVNSDWVPELEDVTVELIGPCTASTEKLVNSYVLCASFNAG